MFVRDTLLAALVWKGIRVVVYLLIFSEGLHSYMPIRFFALLRTLTLRLGQCINVVCVLVIESLGAGVCEEE